MPSVSIIYAMSQTISLNLSDSMSMSDKALGLTMQYQLALGCGHLGENWADAAVLNTGINLALADQMTLSDSAPTITGEYNLVLACPHLGQNWSDAVIVQVGGGVLTLSLSDSMTLSDSLLLGYGDLIADQLTLSDVIAIGYGDLLSDTMTLSDNFAFVFELDERLSDSLSLSDALAIGYGNAVVDQLTLTDSLAIGYGDLIADSMSLSDVLGIGYGDQLTDSLTLTDSVVVVLGLNELLADQLTLTDTVVVVLGLTELLSDQLTLSESLLLGYGDQITDTMTLTDSVALLFALSNTFSETLTISDVVGLGYGFQIADVESLSDSLSLMLGIAELLSDQLSFSDSIAIGYGSAVTDSLTLSDSIAIGYGDQITDTMSLSDSLKIGYGLLFTDQMTLSDSFSAQLLGSLISLFLSDSLTMSDLLLIGYGDQITDALTLTDVLGLGYGDLVSDSLTLTDSTAMVLGQLESIADTLSLSDSLKIGYGLLFTDQLTMTDALVFFPGWAPGDQMVFLEQVGIGYGMLVSDSLNNWSEIFQSGQPIISLVLSDQMSFSEALGAGYGCLVGDQSSMADQVAFMEAMLLLIADATPTQLDALATLFSYGLQVNDAIVFQEQLGLMYGLIIGTESLSMADFITPPQFLNVLSLALADDDSANWLDAVLSQMIFAPSQIVLFSISVLNEVMADVLQVQPEIDPGLQVGGEVVADTLTVVARSSAFNLIVSPEFEEEEPEGPELTAQWIPSEQGAFVFNPTLNSVYGKILVPPGYMGEVVSMLNIPFSPDQFAECTVAAWKPGQSPANFTIGPAVRMSIDPVTGLISCYALEARYDGGMQMVWETNCPPGQLFSAATDAFIRNSLAVGGPTVKVGDVLRIEAVGNRITGKLNGKVIFGPVTDNRIAGGRPGLQAFPENAQASYATQVKNFSAGELPGGPIWTPDLSGVGSSEKITSYFRTITIDHTKVGASDSFGFQLLISGTYSYLVSVANGGKVQSASGYDIIFTTDSLGLNKLTWEIESYDPTTGAISAWVKLPVLSSQQDTVIYMWYGDRRITSFQGGVQGSVWDSNFVSVWHFPNGVTLSLADSTGNGNNATKQGVAGNTGPVAGKVDGAVSFVGSSGASAGWLRMVASNSLKSIGAQVTFEGWIYANVGSLSGGQRRELLNLTASGNFFVNVQSNLLSFFGSPVTNAYKQSVGTISEAVWTHVAVTYDGSNIRLYLNGQLDSTFPATGTLDVANGTTENDIAQNPYTLTTGWAGLLDEVSLSNIARSPDWIRASFNNQNTPSSFYGVGSENVVVSEAEEVEVV